ncbi:MAG: hypothetical protein IPG22_16350 [Acidobacteria bacterium]|nr:hypothetical protein [Acidobacteriota bacterium]
MKRILTSLILISLFATSSVFAGIDSKGAAYQGGTTKDKDFPGMKKPAEGKLDLDNTKELVFSYKLNKVEKTYSIPYDQMIDLEYGQKAGRRVGAAIGSAILLGPIGLFLLFSKKRKHFVTIGYKGTDGKEEVAIFELGKDIIRTSLPILEARSGKKIEYQDDEAKKSSKGD